MQDKEFNIFLWFGEQEIQDNLLGIQENKLPENLQEWHAVDTCYNRRKWQGCCDDTASLESHTRELSQDSKRMKPHRNTSIQSEKRNRCLDRVIIKRRPLNTHESNSAEWESSEFAEYKCIIWHLIEFLLNKNFFTKARIVCKQIRICE